MFKNLFIILIFVSLSAFGRDINIDKLSLQASKHDKILFIFIHTTDCGYCESMREFTLDEEKVKKLIEKSFIFEHINVRDNDTITYQDFRGSGAKFVQEIGYTFYPTSLFFDKESDLIYAKPGYVNEKKFYDILKGVIALDKEEL